MHSTYTTDDLAADTLASAIESGYPWFLYHQLERDADGEYTSAVLTVEEDLEEPAEEGERHTVTPADIKRTFRAMADGKHGETYRKMGLGAVLHPDDADFDVNDADSILQLAILGEIVYA